MLTVCSKCLLRNRGNALDNIMYSYYRVRWLALCYHRNCTAETAVRPIQPSPYAYPPPPLPSRSSPQHTPHVITQVTSHHTYNVVLLRFQFTSVTTMDCTSLLFHTISTYLTQVGVHPVSKRLPLYTLLFI